jgi:hypothetical protein
MRPETPTEMRQGDQRRHWQGAAHDPVGESTVLMNSFQVRELAH